MFFNFICENESDYLYAHANAPLFERCTLIRTMFGRDENVYKPKRQYRRVPLTERFLTKLR
jgi:hypothetical protein